MEQIIAPLMQTLQQQAVDQTVTDCLKELTQQLATAFAADLAVALELIPEAGGTVRMPPLLVGEQRETETAVFLQNIHQSELLGDFMRHWQIIIEPIAGDWCDETTTNDPIAQLIQAEAVHSFIFLPISQQQQRLAAWIFGYRSPLTADGAAMQQQLHLCQMMIGMRLAALMVHWESPMGIKKRMAIAHTLYGQVVLTFTHEMDQLQQIVQAALPDAPHINDQITAVRGALFNVMRHLVIHAAGDLLVDLREMSLSKALNTTAAALTRACPANQRPRIEIASITPKIERFPLKLREILYILLLELMGNAIEHGGPPPYIHVDLYYEDRQVYLQVLDHGSGFDPQQVSLSQHGLGFWQEYVQDHLHGSFHIASSPGFNTAVVVRIPVMV